MISREVIMDCAQRAGFGGQSRNQLYTRLALFAHHLKTWNDLQHAQICKEIGDGFAALDNEFADGQMDGAYKCADALTPK